MNNRTDNTQHTAEELRQAAKRLRDGAAYVAREVPWVAIAKGTGKLAINIVRYSMGIAIYGLIIWPYRLLVAPTCAIAAGVAATQPEDDENTDMFGNSVEKDVFGNPVNNDHPMLPLYIDNWTSEYTLDPFDSHKPNKFGF